MSKLSKIILIIAAVLAAALIFYYSVFFKKTPPAQAPGTSQNISPATSTDSSSSPGMPTSSPAQILPPIIDWLARMTKKSFGIYITQQNSPVQPERFTGCHTGVDFETSAEEQNIDVLIYAVCDGKLLVKRTASGYGGIAVQACKLEGQDVTVIYGHLRPSSIASSVGQELKAGEKLAVLGTGFSQETDGERKHLHLGIHKGTSINILGYVQNASGLQNWVDVTKYLKQ